MLTKAEKSLFRALIIANSRFLAENGLFSAVCGHAGAVQRAQRAASMPAGAVKRVFGGRFCTNLRIYQRRVLCNFSVKQPTIYSHTPTRGAKIARQRCRRAFKQRRLKGRLAFRHARMMMRNRAFEGVGSQHRQRAARFTGDHKEGCYKWRNSRFGPGLLC